MLVRIDLPGRVQPYKSIRDQGTIHANLLPRWKEQHKTCGSIKIFSFEALKSNPPTAHPANMVLIDLATGESADLTQGFGPFDFVPSDADCFEEMMDDDTHHLPRVYPSGIAKLENGGVLPEGSAASGM